MKVRRALHRLGMRYRLHAKDLPGKPDIIFRRNRVAIQVRGCFWHGHECKVAHTPKSRMGYWLPKLARNMERDIKNDRALRRMGWRVIQIWECQLRSKKGFTKQVARIIRVLEAQ